MQFSRFLIVLQREYLQGLRNRYFLLMTLFAPALTLAMVAAAGVSMSLLGHDERVEIIDRTGLVAAALEQQLCEPGGSAGTSAPDPFEAWLHAPRRWVVVHGASDVAPERGAAPNEALLVRLQDAENARAPVDGVLVIPQDALEVDPGQAIYYTRVSADPSVTNELRQALGRTVERLRLARHGLTSVELTALSAGVRVENVQLSGAHPPRSSGSIDFIVGFGLATLMFVPVMIYGQSIMTGIVQEKTDRVIEVLISSISPLTLLTGKILGLAALGLTQIAAWMLIGGVLTPRVSALSPAGAAVIVGSPYLRTDVAAYFVLFFLLAYLVNVCAYAIAGSLGSSHREAQQILMPATGVVTLQWFLVMPVLAHPDSTFACVLSLLPLISPVFMFLRLLASEVAPWQVLLTLAANVAGICLLLRVTASLFRARILSHGVRAVPAAP